MMEEPVLELDDIQGNIFPGFKKDNQHFLFFRITEPTAARAWLKALAPRLSSASEVSVAHALWKHMRRRLAHEPNNLDFLFLNCAFSAAGLQTLGIEGVAEFEDEAFQLGLEARAGIIGDPSSGSGALGAPDTWLVGAGAAKPAVLLTIASDDQAWILQQEAELIQQAVQHGFELLHIDHGRVRPGALSGHEHFGFRDGISFPAIRGRASAATTDFVEPRSWPAGPQFDQQRQLYASPGRQLVWPGHFLFGYPGQWKDKPAEARPGSEPVGPAWARNGSFLVYRRLNQDVDRFHRFLTAAATELREQGFDPDMTPKQLGALLVGRWPSGWPVMRGPDQGPNQEGENYFSFTAAQASPLPNDPHPLNQADFGGNICPFASHIRKVQPRDDGTDLGNMERTFQRLMLRRGITFGPELDDHAAERGLLFVSFQSSITNQFEFVMNNWVNDEDKPKGGSGFDAILGSKSNFTIQLRKNDTKVPLLIPGGWVHATGGEYFFTPGIRFFTEVL
ncbi:Dyp-type peroxidase [Hymenobacter cellulosivorans]|uniref:Dyp-type peroxidase n=1 Tax=Hymenobacter cellulosivorans TaxID=2932249 RepID=A0ABY4FEB4_9BACT|nr:Dyp-type peroxidase [Hymenobacter cellulosivorans]UOQ54333.1 Dyp-type peroxidase [Hymenobacter cellulosivorans]